ncbi:MAG: flagellin [Rhodobacteraceae bacterium]|jgi:flagellin|nr:flagellin [Paracoccaceae bacterium]
MSSILTNTGAMTALQTLKSINMNLSKTQNEISTGKSIATARDGAAIWSISKVMESDVKGFQQISNSLSLGQSTIGVARQAAESITDLLTEIKGLVVSAQEDNVDRAKIQTDISRLRDQITGIVGGAQFNGLNMLRVTPTTTGATNTTAQQIVNTNTAGRVNVLSSLDRSASGVTASQIVVNRADLGTGAQTAGTVAVGAPLLASAATMAAGTVAANATNYRFLDVDGDASTDRSGNRVLAGDTYGLAAGFFTALGVTTGQAALATTSTYVARAGDTTADIARNLADRANFALASAGLSERFTVGFVDDGDGTSGLTITNRGAVTTALTAADRTLTSGGTAGGGLELLSSFNVTSSSGARAALAAVDGLITTATNAAANLGSAQRRMDIQAEFVGKLTDSFKAGIGTLVDANMEEASARLQALQVQQQLGIQSLSIANQAPQSILSLFR